MRERRRHRSHQLRRRVAAAAVGLLALGAVGFGLAGRIETIDTSLFVARGDEPRSIEVTGIIPAPPEAVFEQIATMDGVQRWLGIRSTIELAVGGPYEWYFDEKAAIGTRGTEGSQILGYVPGRMLCVSWNAPPALKRVRGLRSWVTFLIEPVQGGSRVTVVHAGFGDSPGWEQAFRYYDEGWPAVLASLRRSMSLPTD